MRNIPLVGYADRWSARPGSSIGFKVSQAGGGTYEARLVRVVSCDPNPDGPGIIEEDVAAQFAGTYSGREKPAHLGSYMVAGACAPLDSLESLTLAATIWPTTPAKGLQGVLTRRPPAGNTGFALAIDADGATAFLGAQRLAVGKPLVERRWYRIWTTYDARTKRWRVGQTPLSPRVDADDAGEVATTLEAASTAADAHDVMVAAFAGAPARDHFNGKIECPLVAGAALAPDDVAAVASGSDHPAILACWDFSQAIPTPRVSDVGPHGIDGALVNLPARGMTGATWDGSAFAWTEKPEHYAAIHFHDDDLYDCGWETDFAFDIPADMKSGVYAARLRSADGDEEMIPFFVPAPKGRRQAPLCVLIPTLTYAVYANFARANMTRSLRDRIKAWGAWPWNADDHPEYGLSPYNFHADGSGICYSTRRRPVLSLRTATVAYADVPGSALRHFAADAHLWYWLEKKGYAFDVITDDELHAEGADAIAAYDVVTTTSHPEYHTTETLEALEGYVNGGGRFLYLGGNGFYWKVALSDEWPDAVEVRRGEGGIRAWAAEPGEYYHAFDGTYGGLWRRNGRPPQRLCGVGFSAQGDHRGDRYRRTKASYGPDHAWVFAGIDGEVFGGFGLSGGGAAGFELDRADRRLGTPLNAVVLATSEGHGAHFILVPEEILTHYRTWSGEPTENLIRSDIVYFETAKGGAVFSVGSITFCGSLPVDDGDNDVSRLLANVLDRFLKT